MKPSCSRESATVAEAPAPGVTLREGFVTCFAHGRQLDVTAPLRERPTYRMPRARGSFPVCYCDASVMTSTLSPQTIRTVSVPAEFFGALRASVARNGDAVTGLRDAGYSAGLALYDDFGHWLSERGALSPELLPEGDFGVLMAEFLTAAGWGGLRVQPLSEAVVALDADDWAESAGESGGEAAESGAPCCHAGTGLLAGFFGRVAEAPLAVLEVECRSNGDSRCRFLIGSVDVLQYVYEAMERGVPYDRAAESAATG